ncbi:MULTISPECIES: putative Ig domain-containing protein [unclassified Agarivorans]|uniref:putative Ig domain-containing protein n=1 Tax=unclassified Agarivorans TaxID=2636026 RepID=UPI003D7F10A1
MKWNTKGKDYKNINSKLGSLSLLVISLTLTACGGGSEGSNQVPATTNITVFDGLLSNALLCIDSNSNMQCDSNEYSLRTNDQGLAKIPNDNYDDTSPLLVTAIANETTDLDRGLVTQSYQLSTPAGYKIVNPYTHLIQQLIIEGEDSVTAKLEIASLLTSLSSEASGQDIHSMITSNYLLQSDLLAQQVLLIGEMLTDRYATNNDNVATLRLFTEQLSTFISAFDASELANLSPIIELNDGQFSFSYNHAPTTQGSIADQQLEYLGDEISSVNLSAYFDDADGDTLSYSYSPAIAGLSIENDYLLGTPQTAGSYTISIYASDSYSRSEALSFNLVVTDEVQAEPEVPSFTGFKVIGTTPEHSWVFTHADSIYFADSNDGFLDFVRFDSDGTRTSYSIEFDGSLGSSITMYFGDINNPTSITERPLPAPFKLNDDYYFSYYVKSVDDSYEAKILTVGFSDTGVPQLNVREFNYDSDTDELADAYLMAAVDSIDIVGDYQCLNIVHNNKTYSRVGETIYDSTNKSNTFTVSENINDELVETQLSIVLQDVDGMPVRELANDAKCFYHEELDGLVIVSHYQGTSDQYERYDTAFVVYAFIDGKTNKLTTISQSHEKYFGVSNLVITKAAHGAYVLHNGKASMDFNINKLSVNPIDIQYPSEVGIIVKFLANPKYSYRTTSNKFFVIDDDDNILFSIFK